VITVAAPAATAAMKPARLAQPMRTSGIAEDPAAACRAVVVEFPPRKHKKIRPARVILSPMFLAQAATTTASAPPAAQLADWLIFAIVYLGIAVGTIPFTRLSRSAIALLGAIAVVALNRLDFLRATDYIIDWTTLALLFALMLLSASLRVSGFYTRIIRLITDHAHKPWTLLIGLVAVSALLSAIFANDIICLAFTPVLVLALQKAGKNPIPYLIALATSSNIGSAATIIGNPQNMLLGQSAQLNFAHFFLVVSPLVLVCLLLNVLAVALIYRKQLFSIESKVTSNELSPPSLITHDSSLITIRPWHITKALLITAALVAAFLFLPIRREIAALVAAGLVLISRTQDPRKLFALVDWELILLFIGLFVVIGNVQQHALLAPTMNAIQSRVPLYHPLPFSAVTLVLSNLVSNVPAVLLLMPGLAKPLAISDPITHTWYLLAVVSTFAGNLTLLGSIANLIVAEQARPLGIKLTFLEYLKTGLLLTLLTTALAIAYFTWLV
jgi:Na+/H+ antiporter NhaD/arsenite permease-like protein